VGRLGEAVRRAVHEIRAVTLWLQATGGAPVGLLGLSLGGYLAALAAGLWDDFAFVVPMVPPVCIGDLAWQFFRRSRRQDAAQPAFAHGELRRHYRVHSPLAHPLRTPRERTFIVAGRGDRIVPPEHPHALWCHWGHPGIHWYSGGHLTPFGRSEIAASVLRHLASLDLVQG
jgi:acetyl esterase/lipase